MPSDASWAASTKVGTPGIGLPSSSRPMLLENELPRVETMRIFQPRLAAPLGRCSTGSGLASANAARAAMMRQEAIEAVYPHRVPTAPGGAAALLLDRIGARERERGALCDVRQEAIEAVHPQSCARGRQSPCCGSGSPDPCSPGSFDSLSAPSGPASASSAAAPRLSWRKASGSRSSLPIRFSSSADPCVTSRARVSPPGSAPHGRWRHRTTESTVPGGAGRSIAARRRRPGPARPRGHDIGAEVPI